MLGMLHAGTEAFWEAVPPAGLASGGAAAWLMALSWLGHKAFCPRLIHSMVRGGEGEGAWGKLSCTVPLSLSLSFVFSLSLSLSL